MSLTRSIVTLSACLVFLSLALNSRFNVNLFESLAVLLTQPKIPLTFVDSFSYRLQPSSEVVLLFATRCSFLSCFALVFGVTYSTLFFNLFHVF